MSTTKQLKAYTNNCMRYSISVDIMLPTGTKYIQQTLIHQGFSVVGILPNMQDYIHR
jgi:hypothetical protein